MGVLTPIRRAPRFSDRDGKKIPVLSNIRRWILSAVILILLPGLSGCSTFRSTPIPPTDTKAEVAAISALQNGDVINTCLQVALTKQDNCRDSIIQTRLVIIDAQYGTFRQAFYGEARWGSFAATIVNLGLTSAASLTPLGTAHLLSAAATGVTGSQAAYEKQVLVDQTANAIETSMDAGRATVRVRILQGLQQPATIYPLAAALSDLQDYYDSGTLLGALANINQNSGAQAQTANNELKQISGFESNTAALCLQAYTAPDLPKDVLAQHVTNFYNALSAIGIHNQVPAIFASSGDPVQQQAVAQTLCGIGK